MKPLPRYSLTRVEKTCKSGFLEEESVIGCVVCGMPKIGKSFHFSIDEESRIRVTSVVVEILTEDIAANDTTLFRTVSGSTYKLKNMDK